MLFVAEASEFAVGLKRELVGKVRFVELPDIVSQVVGENTIVFERSYDWSENS